MLHISVTAAIADFRVNEVIAQVGGDPEVRAIELHVPENTGGNCLFPTTRVEIFDAKGELLGAIAPFTGTVCFEPGTFFLLATEKAAQHFGVTRDAKLDVPIPAFAGQVCLASSSTRYDCARWGPLEEAVVYLRNTDDETTAASIPDGQSLARVGDTASVGIDFAVMTPTPRQPNDGTVWMGADAGAAPPDAPVPPDAAVPDAKDFTHADAPLGPRPDALFLDPIFLTADPGGGVLCTCRVGARRPTAGAVLLVAALALIRLRRRA